MSQAVISNQQAAHLLQRPHSRTETGSRPSSSRLPLLALLRLIFTAVCMLVYSVVSSVVALAVMTCLVLAPVFLLFGCLALIGLFLHVVALLLHGIGAA